MSRPTVFLLPGLMCDAGLWDHQADALAAVADVRIPVFRGFDSLQAMARHVLAQAPERFSLAGHSMGGRVVWELLALAGNRIDKVAVMDTGVHPATPAEARQRELLLQAVRSKGVEAVAEAWARPMLHPENQQNQALVAEISGMLRRSRTEDYAAQVKALLQRPDRSGLLQTVRQRLWLLVGEEDGWSPVGQHRSMQQNLPASELRIIAGAGHMITLEQPAAVSRVLLEWLGHSVEPGRGQQAAQLTQ